MKRKLLSVAVFMAALGGGMPIYAQFNTVVDRRAQSYEVLPKTAVISQVVENEDEIGIKASAFLPDSIIEKCLLPPYQRNSKEPLRKKHLALFKTYEGMPGLTISNLLYEIRKNGILHEKVVLAQAILETGWFTSNVCRTKNNLFGLTNPRTGEYYEFDHWTESVKAYYTKVQYRYRGGNYLLWLDEIGYAVKTEYILALMRILEQYFI